MGSISEGKLEPELDLTRSLRRVQRSKTRVSSVGVEADKVCVIEKVKELCAELDVVPLVEPPILS